MTPKIETRITMLPPSVDWAKLPKLLNESQAAAAVNVSLSYLRKSRCEGLRELKGKTPPPPFVKVGGRVYYRTSDLERWVDGLAARTAV
jgi:hypothetical protein